MNVNCLCVCSSAPPSVSFRAFIQLNVILHFYYCSIAFLRQCFTLLFFSFSLFLHLFSFSLDVTVNEGHPFGT